MLSIGDGPAVAIWKRVDLNPLTVGDGYERNYLAQVIGLGEPSSRRKSGIKASQSFVKAHEKLLYR